ncbi:hypothetical protein SNE40_010620 [Patella caerulea]|uniref:Peptidase S9 prolyl oligopeptidase catalytic domain-containing protein n=1 Tax=Patella caerulea TaxID=87958 RepID=A0AAN8PT15_PATCE
MTKAAFGSWKSPISSRSVTESAVGLSQISLDQDSSYTDNVYWVESRANENGRNALCTFNVKTRETTTLTPIDYNVRTKVHEYGGKSYAVYQGTVYFSNFTDQALYVQKNATDPVLLTEKNKGLRFADCFYSAKKQRIYCIRESHEPNQEAKNSVVSIHPTTGQQTVIASGADFYSDARVSSDGKQICWIQWIHPNMPWDSTNLYVAQLTENGEAVVEGSVKKIETGDNNSIMEPKWTASNQLTFISDHSNWWNLYTLNSSGQIVNLLPRDVELGGPKWQLGGSAYCLDPKGGDNIITSYGGALEILNTKTGKTEEINYTGYKKHKDIHWSSTGYLYCIADSSTQFPSVIQIDLNSKKVSVLKESRSLSIDQGYFSLPEAITWQTKDKQLSHGYFYPPCNKDYQGTDGELPPLLVRAHGGPTSCYDNNLDIKLQYFTSRGFAVLLVNYRGSTGYGKEYRHSLRGKWGLYDVDDCSSGALYLGKQGKVDCNKLCIDGGSAGGYTTLACLTFTDVFKTGASHYGIGDIESLAAETHKFESRYLDKLIAPYTTEGRVILHERSPINYVDRINCAMAFFQGDEDEVVPPNQAEMMFAAVKAKGKPAALKMYKGEQHGFRKAENIQDALDGEFYFFSKVLGFTSADSYNNLTIENLK